MGIRITGTDYRGVTDMDFTLRGKVQECVWTRLNWLRKYATVGREQGKESSSSLKLGKLSPS
jgi:hypothetical protein